MLPILEIPEVRQRVSPLSVEENGPYTINLTADIALTESLPMIRGLVPGDGSTQITINGNGHTIDANNLGRVFFIESGRVLIQNLTIANALAQGGNGGSTINMACLLARSWPTT